MNTTVQAMPRSERLCAGLGYALFFALVWAVFTHDVYPLAIAAVAALVVSHLQEKHPK